MTLIAKASESNFIPVPAGMHLARCYRVIDLGTQKSEYMGNVKNLRKVMLQFEVHGDDDLGNPIVTGKGEPMTISKNYTLSLAEMATLRKDLQMWRGREFTKKELEGFELVNVLDKWAMISVVLTENNGKTYTNIGAVMPVPATIKQAGLPKAFNKVGMFVIDSPDMEMFNSFSEGLQNKIAQSPEWQSRIGVQTYEPPPSRPRSTPVATADDFAEDDIPF